MIRRLLSERNLVVFVFILVLVIFSFAQEASKSLERMLPTENAKVESPSQSVEKLADTKNTDKEYRD